MDEKTVQAIRPGEVLTSYYYIKALQILVTLRVGCGTDKVIRSTRFAVRTKPDSSFPANTKDVRNEEIFYYQVLVPKGLREPTSAGNKAVGTAFSLGHDGVSLFRKHVLKTVQTFADYGSTVWAIFSISSGTLDVIPSRQFLLDNGLIGETDDYARMQERPRERIDASYYSIEAA